MKRALAYALAGVEVFLLTGTIGGVLDELHAMQADVAAALVVGLFCVLLVGTGFIFVLDALRCPSDVRID